MNEYTFGSVADFISQGKSFKISSKTKKPKIKKSDEKISTKEIQSEGVKENLFTKKKKKKKAKFSAAEITLKGKKAVIERNVTNLKEKTPMFKEEIPDLDKMPSDSEEENESEGITTFKKNTKKNQNIKLEKKDFTENTVFVGNIPINFDKAKVYKIFSKFGKIKTARIRCVPIADINMSKKVAAVKKKFNPNRNSLAAYVKYESQDSANAALQANGMVIQGHHLRVDLAEENKERDSNKAVFVGGLPFSIEDDELWQFFENCGQINSVRVIRDSQTSMGKGFGYVNFDSTASVELALQLDGQLLRNRMINVKRCVKAKNKNKLNAFGRQESKELTNQLLAKRGKKLKDEKKKVKLQKKSLPIDFQGKKANVKQKKKKKLSKAALHKKKVIKILGAA